MGSRFAIAFAPGAISNFFSTYGQVSRGQTDFSHVGAKGGGFILSKGVFSKLTSEGAAKDRVRISVNGDYKYDARTTRLALSLFLAHEPHPPSNLLLEQSVEVPIGQGFGASAASSLSAVLALSAILAPRLSKERVAYYAHSADIMAGTGLGTVSVEYDAVGAGIIVKAGCPGIAKFLNVRVPRGLAVITAAIAPEEKGSILGSPALRSKLNRLGGAALRAAIAGHDFDSLMVAGERFSRRLGLASPSEKAIIEAALASGALFASQNMIGHAVHSIVPKPLVGRVVETLMEKEPRSRIDVMEIGKTRAGVLSSGWVL